MGEYVHLHLHSEYSLLDGLNRIKKIPKIIKEMGMDAVALTDHGNLFGAVDFYKECKKEGIKPIIGCEVYLAPRSLKDKEKGLDDTRYHLTLLVKNKEGYSNLVKLVSIANIEGMYYKPRIDKELLKKHSSGLVCLSGCMAGEIARKILKDPEEAKEAAKWYKEVFKDDYYLEIQDNKIPEQKIINQNMIKIAKELDIKLVATADAHYEKREDAVEQDILICVQTGKKVNEEDRLKMTSDDFYIKSVKEMKESFSYIKEAVDNTVEIANKCNFDFEFGKTKLPNYEAPNGISNEVYIRQLVEKGLEKKYGLENENISKIRERIEYELNVIISMGYTTYFLIVWDFIDYAKRNKIPVGPGRGSGAGSLVAYLLGITDVDPFKYSLIFERFLNPERISMPDFDIDFCNEKREQVIKYVENKYGKDHVAQIITFGTMSARMVIRDVGRVLDIPYGKVDKIAKLIPLQFKNTIKSELDLGKELKKEYDEDKEVRDILDHAMKLEGMPRNASTHACGVVITDKPIMEYLPLYVNDGNIVTQYESVNLEELGFLKMDFLGLRTLTVIDECEKIVKKTRNEEVHYDEDFADQEVFKLWHEGDTLCVFQFESPGMIKFMKEMKPDNIEDIIAGTSLFRPGPMDQIPRYIKAKRNPGHNEYTHKALEPILNVTYGCMVYQEQVMEIVRRLAGYSMGRADLVRRAMGKKKLDVMAKEREIFINGLEEDGKVIVEGCVKRGIDAKSANMIFDEMAEFAKYAFNKSHAASYAMLSYKTAHLKRYYTEEMIAATMNSYMGNLEKIPTYIEDAKKHNIQVLKPDVNESFLKFSVVPNKKVIRFGLRKYKEFRNCYCRYNS